MLNLLFILEDTINNRLLAAPRQWLAELGAPSRIRVLIIIGALLLSVVVPFKASSRQLILAMLLLAGIGGALVLLRWPPLGLLLLVVVALIVPSPPMPGGLNVAVLFLIGLLGLWLLDMLFGSRKGEWIQSRTTLPLLVFIGVTLLSFGVGQLPWFNFAHPAPMDAQLGGLSIFILAAGIFLLTAHQIQDLRWLQWLVWLYLALTSLHLLTWFLPRLGRWLPENFFAPGTANNSLFWVWLLSLALSQAAFNRDLHIGWRTALGILAAATLYKGVFLNSDWKSGYLPLLVSAAAIIGARSWRAALSLAVLSAAPAMYIASEAIATDEYSYATRMDAWIIMFKIIKVNPILGFGPANYYWYTPLFPIRGWAVEFNSHNQYVDMIAQVGLLGMACFLWFSGEVAWLGWKLKDSVPSGFARAYVYGALGGLAGTLAAGTLADWILPFTYNIGLTGFRASMLGWMFLGGLVSVEQIMKDEGGSGRRKDEG